MELPHGRRGKLTENNIFQNKIQNEKVPNIFVPKEEFNMFFPKTSQCHGDLPHRALLHQRGGRAHRAAGGVDRELEGLAQQIPGAKKRVSKKTVDVRPFFSNFGLLMFGLFSHF